MEINELFDTLAELKDEFESGVISSEEFLIDALTDLKKFAVAEHIRSWEAVDSISTIHLVAERRA